VPTPAAALVVDQLSVTLGGRRVLDRLNVTAATGALTAVLGPNGAGKTTLIRCCTGLLRPDAGTVSVLGRAAGSAEVAARVGLMPQSTGAWSGIRAVELLRYLSGLYASPLDVTDLVERCGISAFADVPYRRLSGGQQQAVNLAGALIGRPELVFLDEPTAGMDPHARRATWTLLTELRAAGVAIVLTTHAMDEAQALADRVFIVDRGRVAVAGTVAELTAGGGTLEDVFLSHTHGADTHGATR
jgi:ABC-2 type transport system ATP-binding protein